MADTIQLVSWWLVQSCKLRQGEAVEGSDAAFAAVSRAATFAKYIEGPQGNGFGVYGDVCVTSYTFASKPRHLKRKNVYFPCDGFLLSESFPEVGGTNGLLAMCGGCSANANDHGPAGCVGTIYQNPDSAETQEQLEGIVSRLGLDDAYREAFLPTTPLWYGMWARSPLQPAAVRLIGTIINEMLIEDTADLSDGRNRRMQTHLPELAKFVRATELADKHNLKLHVSLAPLGHTDLGFYTVFPHCPVCKAMSRLERWQREYPTRLYTCESCGSEYPPAETASSERMAAMSTGNGLKVLLGERFAGFAKEFVMATSGLSKDEADEVLAATEASEREREEIRAANKRRDELQRRYVHSVLFAGLHPVLRRDDDADEDDSSGTGANGVSWFNATECEELVRRCESQQFRITAMQHFSKTESLSRFTSLRAFEPQKVLAQWRAEGCDEQFYVFVKIPDDVLKNWEAENHGGGLA